MVADRLSAFDRVVTAIASGTLWKTDGLRAGFAISAGPSVHLHSRDFPDVERLRSLMLDFRKLIANDEPSNLNALCNALCRPNAVDPWPEAARVAIDDAKTRFNQVLDSGADFYRGSDRPTVRGILDDWLNGEWFHLNDERRQHRIDREIVQDSDLSLAFIVSSVREAISIAIELRSIIDTRSPMQESVSVSS